jgi:RNA polymerase sigma-70 factor (ECF subfamily)
MDCFAILFHRYCKLVLAIGWKVLRQESEAEDLVQEVFLAIFAQKHPYDEGRGSVKTWIAQLAYWRALMRRRYLYTRRLTPLEDALPLEQEAGWRSGTLCDMERATLVEQSLALLNPRQRRTIELIHFEGYTLLEAAAALKESLANTRNQYYRGMKSLRAQMTYHRATDATPGIATQDIACPEDSDLLIRALGA